MTQSEFEIVLEQARKLRKMKNEAYGNSFVDFYNESGWLGVLSDINRKFSRIKHFANTGKEEVPDETIEDTLLDLSIMCMNAIVWNRNRKRK